VFEAALGDLLNLAQDCCFTRVLLHELAETLFGEVGSNTRVARMSPKGGQDALR